MKHINKITCCLAISFLFCGSLIAQSVLPPGRMEIYMQRAPDDSTIVFNNTSFSNHSILLGTVYIKLQDTLNVAKIHVKVGTSPGASDLFSKTFLFDVQGNFSDNTSYTRTGFKVMLGIGQFIGLNHYYSEVRLEDTSQNLSDAVHYNKN